MEKDQLPPGTVLAEKYRLESVLGEGGMGTVYRAEHLALRAPVAVKVIDRKVEEGDVTFARFMREAQSAAALRSPHVVQILDYGMDQGRPFMVMELLEGEPLADRLKRAGRLSPEETYRILLHVAKAVSKAHEADIVHRDLKPDNIFLVHNEGDELAKVLDFGVAKVEATALDGQGHTRTGSLLGTPYYMSPEQAQGNKDVDGRSDLWALGVIAYECLVGTRPFQSDGLGDLVLQICIRDIPVPSHSADVPPEFDAWFKKACGREPDERFQSARELADALRSGLGLDLSAAPESRWASPADRGALPRGGRATEGRDEADTQPALGSQPDNSLTPALRSSALVAPHDRTLIDESPRERFTASDEWRVVPMAKRSESAAQPSAAQAADPLLDTHGPSSATRVFWVAILAITFGAGAVFYARELGLVSWGNVQLQKPLDVVGAPQPKPKKASRPAEPEGQTTDKARPDGGTAKKRDHNSTAPNKKLTPEQQEELKRLEDLRQEAVQNIREAVPPPPIPAPEVEPTPAPPEDKAPAVDSSPEPVLPHELTPPGAPSGSAPTAP